MKHSLKRVVLYRNTKEWNLLENILFVMWNFLNFVETQDTGWVSLFQV